MNGVIREGAYKWSHALLWGLLAVFFPLITLIIVLLLPARFTS